MFLLCRLKELASAIEKKGIALSNVCSANQPLRLGQLQGNRFDIILRDLSLQSHDCSASLEKRVSEALENVKVKLFHTFMISRLHAPNYLSVHYVLKSEFHFVFLICRKMVS